MTIASALKLAKEKIPKTHEDIESLSVNQVSAWKMLFDFYNRDHPVPKQMSCLPCFYHIYHYFIINCY